MIKVFGHPFSSYTWKALIAFHENAVPFVLRMIDPSHPENAARLNEISPQGKFPAIIDGAVSLFEASIIIEHLHQRRSGPVRLIPDDPAAALEVRMLDRFFDNYVMAPMSRIVADFMRDSADRDPRAVAEAKDTLWRSYSWLDSRAFATIASASSPGLPSSVVSTTRGPIADFFRPARPIAIEAPPIVRRTGAASAALRAWRWRSLRSCGRW